MLTDLQLKNFRNYQDLQITLKPGINCILGRNGQGKTNLLESIYYLSLLRSFRSRQIKVLKNWQQSYFYISANIKDIENDFNKKISVSYAEKRVIKIDDQPTDKASEFINQYLCLAFIPQDIELVRGSKKLRRQFMDISLSQVDLVYMRQLQRYKNILKSRNAILRTPHLYQSSLLKTYDHQLAQQAAPIIIQRAKFIYQLNQHLKELSKQMFLNDDRLLNLRYSTNIIPKFSLEMSEETITESIIEQLANSAEKDREDGQTRHGPHRDNFTFNLGKKSLNLYGSSGECRLASICLRLASLKNIRKFIPPEKSLILLLDDIFGELDDYRREALFYHLNGPDQIFIATTTIPPELKTQSPTIYNVEDGNITS